MNADRPPSSSGDLSTIPSTPKGTPTPTEFPHSIFETPKANQSNPEALPRWTPQPVEEYPTFNTPGCPLPGTPGPFPDLPVSTPYQPSSFHERLLSAGDLAVDIASHANNYFPSSVLPLPTDPSRRHPSSPTAGRPYPSPVETDCLDDSQSRIGRKVRRGTIASTTPQTATPPPSTRKSERRLAPKPQTSSMQHDEFESEFVANAPQQQSVPGNFASASIDMFGMPLSATSSAPSLEDNQGFWDPGMGGMDIDFSIPFASAFHDLTHRSTGSLDWGKGDEMFQEPKIATSKTRENIPQKKERLLAPKPAPMPNVDTSMTEASVFAHSFHMSADDTFASLHPAGGVDPGLLFTRPPSSNIELAAFDPLAQPILMNSLPSPQLPPPPMKEPKRGQVRRSASTRETGKSKKDKRVSTISPVKPSSRPGLLRSASDSRARKPMNRASVLSNAVPLTGHGLPASSSQAMPMGSRTSGRTSPLKNHQRLSSLSSIPEHAGPRTRTSVRFTIDAHGRARAETLIVDDELHTPSQRRRGADRGSEWESSEDDSSSTDDEPIIIPSRNASFALPESRAPLYTRPSRALPKSFSNGSTSSLGIYYAEPNSAQGDVESDAETVTNITVGNNQGDAMSELWRVREDRQKRIPALNTNNPFASGGLPGANSTISPTNLREAISTSSADRGNRIRCVCNTTFSHIAGDGYMVQCESCEMWLHGTCVKITRQTLPRVYICAFCANTPTSHGRGARKNVGGSNSRIATSSLSHKSIHSFR
ncbi:hypothetical protein GGR50DRAFT_675293 [Xylaria sp. CBS 124048]|nr:hypothetical protein GGR50DRAFT_675293 [Xylaria sp. CBS 124048]